MKTRATAVVLVLFLATLPLLGQTFISAKAGLVNYEEGVRATSPRQLIEGERFTTPNRSEVLMIPGSFLRLERDAEIYMVSTRLTHPAVELTKGLVSLEMDETPKDSNVTLSWNEYKGDRAFVIDHKGLYRFEQSEDGSSLKIMVMVGRLTVPGGPTLKDGHELIVGGSASAATIKFDRKERDDFDQWGAYRASLLSTATVRTAQAMSPGYYPTTSVWAFNSWLGMFAYLPYGGYGVGSPYGYWFYTPIYIGRYYGNYGGGGGIGALPVRGSGGSSANNSNNGIVQRPAPRIPIVSGPSTTGPASSASNAGYSRPGSPASIFSSSPAWSGGGSSLSGGSGVSGSSGGMHASPAPVGGGSSGGGRRAN